MAAKDQGAFRTIGEVSEALALPQHVLRFWEARFPQIAPLKRGGNRRYYRPDDLALLSAIKRLLYEDGYTIKGVQRLLRSMGARAVVASDAASSVPADATPVQAAPGGVDPHGVTPPSMADIEPDALAALIAEIEACAAILAEARVAASVVAS